MNKSQKKQRIKLWKHIWINCYSVTIESKQQCEQRLKELKSWDTPLPNDREYQSKVLEYGGKKLALKHLISKLKNKKQ
jgi:hypothetical protein